MGNTNNTNNSDKDNQKDILDLAIKVAEVAVVSVAAKVTGTLAHRVQEIKSRKKAQDLAIKKNNEEIEK